VTEEGEAKSGVGADPVESVLCDVDNFIDGVAAQVGEFQ
jgi:hypothetical protein